MFPKVSHMGLVFSLTLSLWACRSDNETGDTVADAAALPDEENDLFEPEDIVTSDQASGDITEDRDRRDRVGRPRAAGDRLLHLLQRLRQRRARRCY